MFLFYKLLQGSMSVKQKKIKQCCRVERGAYATTIISIITKKQYINQEVDTGMCSAKKMFGKSRQNRWKIPVKEFNF